MSDIKHNSEIKKIEYDSLLELIELDISPIYAENEVDFNSYYRFHNYPVRPEDSNATTDSEKNAGALVYQGNAFYPFPYMAQGFDQVTDNALPRPTIRISNISPIIRNLSVVTSGLVGAYVYRYRVFYKYLDNMPEAEGVVSAFARDMYIVLRKKTENKFMLEFELVTPLEHGNIGIPRRQMLTHTCTWRYRCDGCGYIGQKIVDINNKYYGTAGDGTLSEPKDWAPNVVFSVNDVVQTVIKNRIYYYLCIKDHTSNYYNKFSSEYWVADVCSKTLDGCNARHDGILPASMFPNAMIG